MDPSITEANILFPIPALDDVDSVGSVLELLPRAAVAAVPGADSAGVVLFLDRHEPGETASSDSVAGSLDAYQYASDEGPGLDAARADLDLIRVDDLERDGRWPGFADEATALGVFAVLALRLHNAGVPMGALSIYATAPGRFTDDSVEWGRSVAAQASSALSSLLTSANLEFALVNRDVIGQAKGIIMERFKVGAAEAFDLLVTISRDRHVTLRDLAHEFVASGELALPAGATRDVRL